MATLRGRKVHGSAFADVIHGLASDDQLFGNNGNDTIFGGLGRDRMFGGNGNDRLIGGEGNDYLDGGPGTDYIDGGNGIDIVTYAAVARKGVSVFLYKNVGGITGETADRLYNVENVVGTKFVDYLQGNDFDNVLDGGAERDFLWGLGGNDTLIGGNGADWIFGGDGDDVLRPGTGGGNNLDGGAGYDTLDYSDLGAGIEIVYAEDPYTPNAWLVQGGQGTIEGERIFNAELIRGSNHDDKISEAHADVVAGGGDDQIISHDIDVFLRGGDDDDQIEAAGNNQLILGDDGLDWLLGGTFADGASSDVQIFQLQYARGHDTIWYFGTEDKLRVSMSEFGITDAGQIDYEYSLGGDIGPVPTSAQPTFMFVDDESSFVWFDRDGTGSEYSAVALAYVMDLNQFADWTTAFEFVA